MWFLRTVTLPLAAILFTFDFIMGAQVLRFGPCSVLTSN